MADNRATFEFEFTDEGLDQIIQKMGKLDDEANKTKQSIDKGLDSKPIREYERGITRAGQKTKELGKQSRLTTRQTLRLTSALGRAGASSGVFSKGLGRNIGLLSSFGVGLGSLPIAAGIAGFAGLAGGAELLSTAISFLNGEYTEAGQRAKEVRDLTKELSESFVDERSQLDALIAPLNDSNASQEEKEKAIAALNQQYPEYLTNVDNEALLNGEVVEVYDKLNKAIIDNIVNKAKAQKASEIFQKLIELETAAIERQGDTIAGFDAGELFAGAREELTKELGQLDSLFADVAKNLQGSLEGVDVSAAADPDRIKSATDAVTKAEQKALEEREKARKRAADKKKRDDEKAAKEEERKAKKAAKVQEQILKDELKLRFDLIFDAEKKEIEAANNKADRLKEDVNRLIKSEQERDKFIKDIEANRVSELQSIRDKFRNDEATKQKQAFDRFFSDKSKELQLEADIEKQKLEAKQASDFNTFSQTSKTQEEITAFQAKQEQERQRLDLETQKKKIQAAIEFGAFSNELEKQFLEESINNINAQIANIGQDVQAEQVSDKRNIFDLFGIDLSPEEQQKAVDAIKNIGGQIIGELNNIFAQRVELAQQEIDARNNRITELQTQLQTELALEEAGKSANVALTRQQLEEEKALRSEALEEQKKAQKAQEAVQTVQQAVNLITASTQIFNSLAGIPFVGIPLAIATIGVMFGAFVAAKAQAAKATKLYGGGMIPLGKDDRGGGEGYRIEGTNIRVGGGEWITPVEQTSDSRQLLEAITAGHVTDEDLPNLLASTEGQRRQMNITLNNNREKERQRKEALYKATIEKEIRDMSNVLHKDIRDLIEQEKTTSLGDGRILVTKQDGAGNISRKIIQAPKQ